MKISRLIFLALFLLTGIANGQNRTRTPLPNRPAPQQTISLRKVAVNLKDGTTTTGTFIQADRTSVQIEVAGNRLTIKLDDIVSIQFAETSGGAASAASVGQAQLSLEAGLVYKSGDTKALSRVTFYLLDADLGKILQDAGLQPDESLARIYTDTNKALIVNYASSLKFGILPKFQAFSTIATPAIKPHIIQTVTTDFSGKAAFEPLAAGSYFLMGYTETARGYAIWNLPVSLKAGVNSIVIDQNNAVDAR